MCVILGCAPKCEDFAPCVFVRMPMSNYIRLTLEAWDGCGWMCEFVCETKRSFAWPPTGDNQFQNAAHYRAALGPDSAANGYRALHEWAPTHNTHTYVQFVGSPDDNDDDTPPTDKQPIIFHSGRLFCRVCRWRK